MAIPPTFTEDSINLAVQNWSVVKNGLTITSVSAPEKM
jgi:hypothetical protein